MLKQQKLELSVSVDKARSPDLHNTISLERQNIQNVENFILHLQRHLIKNLKCFEKIVYLAFQSYCLKTSKKNKILKQYISSSIIHPAELLFVLMKMGKQNQSFNRSKLDNKKSLLIIQLLEQHKVLMLQIAENQLSELLQQPSNIKANTSLANLFKS